MLPYFEQPTLSLGPLHLSAFGLLVALGVLLGFRVALRRGRATGISRERLARAAWIAVLAGFPLSFLVLLAVEGPKLAGDRGWRELLSPPYGMSSLGGWGGALLGLWIYHAVAGRSWWREADALAGGLAVGWILGRLGCSFAHDHPGRLSDFPLAFAYPGGARHDLGFYEFLYTALVLVPASVLAFRRRPGVPGLQVALLAGLYAPARFLLDFLRAEDLPDSEPRWAGLTFAQWACFVLAAFAIWLARRIARGAQPEVSGASHG